MENGYKQQRKTLTLNEESRSQIGFASFRQILRKSRLFPGIAFWILFLLHSGDVAAQAIFSNPINGTNPSSSNPFLNGQTVDPNLNANGIGRGNGNIAVNSNNSYSLRNWKASSLNNGKYFEFTMTPDAGYQINFISFVYNGTISSGSANYAFRSSLDNFSSNIGSASVSGNISLNGTTFQGISSTITFRLYCWGANNNNVRIAINNFSFKGTVQPSSTSPVITTHPESATACQNSSMDALRVEATPGSGSISSYQWYSNNSNTNVGGSPISGANLQNYTPPGNSTGTFYYFCQVNNSDGLSTRSNPATITISPAGGSISTTTPGSRCGNGTVVLGATASSGTVKWYAASSGGSALGSGNTFTTPSISSTTTYYAEALNGTCGSGTRTAVVATINTSPTLSSTTPGSRCGTGTVLLAASSPGATVNWFTTASGGSSVASGNSFTTPTISSSTTYYAEATNGQCTSASRTAVPATINAIPSITSSSPASRCGSGTLSLSATASAGTVNWYAASSGGTALGSGSTFTTPSITTSTNYYAEAAANGCISSSRTAVQASIKEVPAISSANGASRCGNGTLTLTASTSTGTLEWYSNAIGGSPLGTGTSWTSPSLNSSRSYYVTVNKDGCYPSTRTEVQASVTANPTVLSAVSSTSCGSGSKTLSATPSAGAINWYSAASGGSPLGSGNSFTTPHLSSNTNYYAEAVHNTCTSARTQVSVTILSAPALNIEPNYCSGGGLVVLTASPGFNSYLWNTDATTHIISVDQAGIYSVQATSAAGCTVSASIPVASELVVNGDFSDGNTGFSTNYTFKPDIAGNLELFPEGTYSIVPNANTVHSHFHGTARRTGGGNIMVINGSPETGATVWSQNNTSILPNTTYYFSAWAMSVVNQNNAVLQFSINGTQVGTIAYLPNSYTNNDGPYTWVRFYGQWNSGSSTTANLSIVNLNTVLGGNDFALDDISFGTLSPTPLSASPIPNGNTGICMDGSLVLTSNALGGASPFTYTWSGPNGFSSTSANPLVTNRITSSHNGTYSLTVRDGLGCSVTQTVNVNASNLPLNQTVSALASTVCSGASTSIRLQSTEAGVSYQLRRKDNDEMVGSELQGTGNSLDLPTGTLHSTSTFVVYAIRYSTGCSIEMSTEVTVQVAEKPNLVITNQAACSGAVNLTAASVTNGSTGNGTLSYWTNAAATNALNNPSAVSTSGIYYIKSTSGLCSDIKPVSVSISANPVATFTYPGSPFCSSEANPQASFSGGAIAGVFSSTSGLVFQNTSTGLIDLAASTPGTYVVTNKITPTGACASVTATRSITITGAPNPAFSYVSNGLCQSPDAASARPIFTAGASAGTFSSSTGLVFVSTATGEINILASTPGNYGVINRISATGGCAELSDTFFVRINPYTFEGAINASSSQSQMCEGSSFSLYSSGSMYQTVLLREEFESSLCNWTTGNSSTGGTPANAAWTIRPDRYQYSGNTFRSNDRSDFYLSNSRAQGPSSSTVTVLKSPQMSTVGFSTLNMDFFHFFNGSNSGDVARVQVSSNNSTWTDVASYTSTRGSAGGFVNESINLNNYVGLPSLYVRFLYTASYDRYWAIDNVSITGQSNRYTYSWDSSPSGFTSNNQNTTATAETSRFYVVTAMNSYGCRASAIPVPVTVDPAPGDNAGADKDICGAGGIGIGKPANLGRTYSWTPSTGLSDASIADPIASPGATTTYTLTETITQTGCSSTNEVKVNINSIPTITSSTPGSRCAGGIVTLEAISSTGTVKWYAAATGGTALSNGNTFTTPSLTSSRTYYADPTASGCPAASRTPVEAVIASSPAISSQATSAATYSQYLTANPLSIVASAGTGTISSYQWYVNSTANNTSGTAIEGATEASYIPPTDQPGVKYYYCVITNKYTCFTRSTVSGAITTITAPVITGIAPHSPSISGQDSSTGYRGQSVYIIGRNFKPNSTVKFNGVAASSVSFVNSGLLTAIVNNSGANESGTVMVTDQSTGAYGTAPFSYIGYLSKISGDWSLGLSWWGGTLPTSGSDVTIANANLLSTAISPVIRKLTILPGASLSLSTGLSSLSTSVVNNFGSLIWLGSGTLSIKEQLNHSEDAIFNAGTGTVRLTGQGEQKIFSGKPLLVFHNLIMEGAGEKILAEGTDLQANNITVADGVELNLTHGPHSLRLLGNVNLDGDMKSGSSLFEFAGSGNQELSVRSADTIALGSLKLNKTSGSLILKSSVQLNDSLVMSKGNIQTGTNLLILGTDAQNTGLLFHNRGLIEGKMRRWYAASQNNGTETGLFPMGQIVMGLWRNRNVQLNYTTAPSQGGHLTVEYKAEPMVGTKIGTQNIINPENTGGAGFTITNFSNEGYWKIDNEAGKLIDGEYTISLNGEGYMLPSGLLEITLVKRVNGGDWFCPGIHMPVTGSEEMPVLSRSGVSGFSNFGYAGGANNALPVSLISFKAECEGSNVVLNWATASETNNHQFIVEESPDGENWNVVSTADGSGNSTTIKQYRMNAPVPASGEAYYRLTQVDYNGESETFDPVFISCADKQANEVKIYPNPASDWVNVEITVGEPLEVQLAVFNSGGQILMLQKAQLVQGSNLIRLDISGVPQGAYHLNISNALNREISGGRSIIKR